MATNPRIDDLRKRLEKEPNSRLFAQLAEELRKDGEFEEAIRILRAGLARHPAYPSARMTLGRALFDTGDMAAARAELQSVLDGAPDNILASRLLAECLEALGDFEGALKRYRATLALSPGDKQITSRIAGLEGKLHASARPAASAEPAPIKLAEVNEPMELEISRETAAPAASPPASPAAVAAPIPVTAAPAEFELETAYEAPGTQWGGAAPRETPIGERTVADEATPVPIGERTLADEAPPPASPAVVVAPEPIPPPEPVPAPYAPASHEPIVPGSPAEPAAPSHAEPFFVEPVPAPSPEPVALEGIAPEPIAPELVAPELVAAEPVAPEPAPPEPAAGTAAPALVAAAPEETELVSPTLAELYFNQGFPEKAIEVYRRLLERDPGNERARARVAELQDLAAAPRDGKEAAPRAQAMPAPASSEDEKARAARRLALERTIERLESLRAALQKGAR